MLFILADGPLNRLGPDLPVRSMPDSLPVAQHDGLRRFVSHARARFHVAGKIARRLYDEKRDIVTVPRHLLISGTADRTRRAVFEEDDRAALGKLEKLVQRASVRQRIEPRSLLSPHCPHPQTSLSGSPTAKNFPDKRNDPC